MYQRILLLLHHISYYWCTPPPPRVDLQYVMQSVPVPVRKVFLWTMEHAGPTSVRCAMATIVCHRHRQPAPSERGGGRSGQAVGNCKAALEEEEERNRDQTCHE